MKIALLSGADKNAGDFLIVHRTRLLLENLVEECQITEFPRNRPLDDRLEELNSYDVVIFAGGPGYVPDMYPGRFPLVGNLASIKPPLFALGMGGYTPTPSIDSIAFSRQSKELLGRLEADGFGLGCRDRLTERLLKASGCASATFTGCPAWYDLGKVGTASLLSMPDLGEIRQIAISDPAVLRNMDAPKYLISELKKTFPLAEIRLIFHRGWTEDAFTSRALARAQAGLAAWARENGVEPVDISYSHEGFAEYDDCDLHVGYRVHAHLYNVSQRKPSYLIEEDGRGYGANDALGCSSHIALGRPAAVIRVAEKVLRRARVGFPSGRRCMGESARRMVAHIVEEAIGGYPEANGTCQASSETFFLMRNHILGLNAALTFPRNESPLSSRLAVEKDRL